MLGPIFTDYTGIRKMEKSGNTLQLYFEGPIPDAGTINRFCFDHGVILNHLRLRKKSLESEFISLTNNVSN